MYNTLHEHHREIGSARDWIALPDNEVTGYFGDTLKNQIKNEAVFLLTAVHDGNVAGFVRVVERKIEGFSKMHAYMDPLIVDPAVRGKGIGTELFRRGVRWAREQNFESIWLDVWEENSRVVKLYEREGFRSAARTMAARL